MRLYGVTEEGHSVVAHIHGYDPYFYVQVSLRCARALSLSLRYLLKISLEYFLEVYWKCVVFSSSLYLHFSDIDFCSVFCKPTGAGQHDEQHVR